MTDKYAILSQDDATLLSQCRIDVFVGTGRGGQKRNKTSSAVRLTHKESGVVVSDDTSRSQHQNRIFALRKLRIAIALFPAETPPPAVPDITVLPGEKSARYPLWIAQFFDLLNMCAFNTRETASILGCSTSKLTRILQKNPLLWQKVLQQNKNMTEIREH